jgi:hypothetical protein
MSPSLLFFGSRCWLRSVSVVVAHAGTAGMVTCRRHFPICITTGKLVPAGTFLRVKVPVASVSVVTSGSPLVGLPQRSQVKPGVNGLTSPLGT